jgi:hypothetical protein
VEWLNKWQEQKNSDVRMNSKFRGNEWCNVVSGKRRENLIWNYGQTENPRWKLEWNEKFIPLMRGFMACVGGGWIEWLGGWECEVGMVREVSLRLTKKSIIQNYNNSPLTLILPLPLLHSLFLHWRSWPVFIGWIEWLGGESVRWEFRERWVCG